MNPPTPKGVLLTGTIGAGKTAVATDIGEILEEREAAAAIVDVDWLGWTTLPEFRDLMYENLAAVWANYASAGVEYLVLARLVESEEDIAAIRSAVDGVELPVVRVDADPGAIRSRLERRDTGAILSEHLEDSVRFQHLLNRLPADLVVTNDGSVRDTAKEVMRRLGWE